MSATSAASRRLPQPLRAVLHFRRSLTSSPPTQSACLCPTWSAHANAHAHRSSFPAISTALAISSRTCPPTTRASCRPFTSQADRPPSAPLFVVPDDPNDSVAPQPGSPPPGSSVPPPESMTVEQLLETLPHVLQSGDPASIFAHYASLFNSHPSALTDSLFVDILNALAPSDTLSCINVFQDWLVRKRAGTEDVPTLSTTASAPPRVLVAYLSALRHASSTQIFISGISIVISALENTALGNSIPSLRGLGPWWRVLDTVLDMYAPDLFPSRMHAAGPLAIEILRKAQKLATLPDGRMADEWDPTWVARYEIRALGQAGDLSALVAHFDIVTKDPMLAKRQGNVPVHSSEWITAFAHAGDFTRARTLFITCVQTQIIPSLESAHALLLCAAKSSNLQGTLDLQSALFDVYGSDVDDPTRPGINLYAPVMEACRKALSQHRFARYQTAEDWTHRLYIANVYRETHATITRLGLHMSESMHETALACKVLANYDDHYRYPLKDAAAALEAMIQDGYMPTQYALHTLMRGYANTRESINVLDRVTVILQYVQIMRTCNVPVTAETYSIAFLALNPRKHIVKPRAAVIQRLNELHKEMTHQAGIRHTHQSFHAYLRVLGAHGGWQHLYRAFDGMASKYGLKPNAATYFTMMHALQRDPAGAQYAIDVLEPQMRAEGVALTPDVAHSLLACCVTVNNEPMAWKVFETMGRLGFPVTHTVLNYLLKLALFNGRIQHAQFVLDEFARRGMFFDPTTYYHLMTYFAKINPDQDKVHLLIEHLRGQADVCEQFSLLTGCLTAGLTTPILAKDAVTAPSLDFHPLPADLAKELADPAQAVASRKSQSASAKLGARVTELTIPALPALPPETCHPLQRPIQVLMDSRLHLKELQLHIGKQDYVHAFQSFTSLLCDFHVAMLHRFATARQYRAEAIADFAAREAARSSDASNTEETAEDTMQAVISRQPMLSYPPRIVHYEPYNSRAGLLYLPKDVATATWLMCQSLLHMPQDKLPANFPAFRYVQLQPANKRRVRNDARWGGADASDVARVTGNSIWDAADAYLSRISFKLLPVAGMHKVAVARVVFRSSMRALNAVLGFPTMIRFDWVKDLLHKLAFDVQYSQRYQVQIRRAGMFSDAAGETQEERARQMDPVFSGMPKSVIEQLVWDERKRRDDLRRSKEDAMAAEPAAAGSETRPADEQEDLRVLASLLRVKPHADLDFKFKHLPFTGASPATLPELMIRQLPEELASVSANPAPAPAASGKFVGKLPEDVLADEHVMESEISQLTDGMDEAAEVRKTMYREHPRGKLGRPARVSAETALEREGPLDL